MPDNDRQIPLSRAASNGHDIVVKLLKGRVTANPDTPENESPALFRQAAVQVSPEAVKTQQTPEVVNPEEPKDDGPKPPALAVKKGYHRVMEILSPQKSNLPPLAGSKPRQ
ncbi:hypothetical protein L873DRAFT_1858086 [Choiromyces venosus 120613-1]|uniref:Ankyrin n=1 Tax=Choiromyces venosus 120613-1 TaxID=1336337 RepID=A0A3N4J3K5_9PEZI|nr:hypothetical protein L873DRAFT_1858086 [Choiromyces venosus 120613-1]